MASVKGVLVSAMASYLAQEYGADAVAAATKELSDEDRALLQKRFLDASMYPYETMVALRHLMRDRVALLPPGSLVVVRALPGAGDADHEQLARDLDAAVQRLLGGGAR